MDHEKKISSLQLENERLNTELKMTKPNKQINIGQPNEDNTKAGAIVAKFEQLLKEVDQCFAELGRQMQRESKARHDFENKIKEDIQHTGVQLEIKVLVKLLFL